MKLGYSPLIQFSPEFHTTLLYWACMFQGISVDVVKNILKELEAYPEGPVSIDHYKTPCHAAAQVGNVRKLKELMIDINKRYKQEQAPIGNQNMLDPLDKYKKKNLCPDFQVKWSLLLNQIKYRKFKTFSVNVFNAKLKQYRMSAESSNNPNSALTAKTKGLDKFTFDFLDINQNSPLHIASQFGNPQCIDLLLMEYNLSIDTRNIDGWMAKDIIQHEAVRNSFRSHYKRIDRMIQQNSQVQQEGGINTISSGQLPSAAPVQRNLGQVAPIDQNALAPYSGNERNQLNNELLQCREYMPFAPNLVLKVNIPKSNPTNSGIVNNMIELLTTSKFKVQMIPSLDDSLFYISLKMEQPELEQEAKFMEMKIKLNNVEAKRIFDPQQKWLYEPFRSKDIQKIMLSRLSRLINMQQLRKQSIILSVLVMHDLFGLHEIKTRWWRTADPTNKTRRKCCPSSLLLQPLPLMSQLYRESMIFQFSELSSIKNYFGEKVGFYYAYMSYYTVWLLIPAICGLALTIYQFLTGNVDTIFTSLYALLVCIWVTIFIERWKRKSAEICLKWGVSEQLLSTSSEQRIMRDDFQGFEYFSHVTHNTEKRTFKAERRALFFILQVLIYVILIGGCIAAFFGNLNLKNAKSTNAYINRFMSIIAGVVNGIIIGIIDFIYSYIATFFISLENHKYSDSYEKSYVFKIFVFKFINTNISIFYTAFNDRNFNQLYYLILGMSITKVIQIFLMKNFKKFGTFWFKKKLYFRRVAQQARKQRDQHQLFINEIESKQQRGMQTMGIGAKIAAAMKKLALFKNLDLVGQPTFQRLVFNATSDSDAVNQQHILIDYVELNDIMLDRSELVEIYETSEVFILFGLATLYSCACPIVPLIAMVHNIVDINFSLFVGYTSTRRKVAEVATNIDPWLSIAQFMAFAAVLSNSLLLYFSTPTLHDWVEAQLKDSFQEVYLLWIIVGVEHFIILIKQFFALVIKDIPNWVEKSQQRVQREERNLAILSSERDQRELLKVVNDKLIKQDLSRKQERTEMERELNKLATQIKDKNMKIELLENQVKDLGGSKEDALKKLKQMKQTMGDKMKDSNQMSLVDFLGIAPSEWFAKGRTAEIDKALIRSFSRRLLYQTFTGLEKNIISRRVGRLFDTKITGNQANTILVVGLQINCAQCLERSAILECLHCVDHFCKSCSDELHGNIDICKDHKLVQLTFQLGQATEIALLNPKTACKWKKFEYYNFPVMVDNDHYSNLQLFFMTMRQRYLDMNYIESTERINLQSLFVDKQYDLLTDIQAKALMTRDKRIFSQDIQSDSVTARTSYNDEELYYMNRVLFTLFANKSHNATFQQFTKSLGVLQSGPFMQRLTFWLQLLNEEYKSQSYKPQSSSPGDSAPVSVDEGISKQVLEEALKFAYVQRRPTVPGIFKEEVKSYKDIVNMVFNKKEKVQDDDIISISQFLESVNKNEEIREFMQCVLQFNRQAFMTPAATTAQGE